LPDGTALDALATPVDAGIATGDPHERVRHPRTCGVMIVGDELRCSRRRERSPANRHSPSHACALCWSSSTTVDRTPARGHPATATERPPSRRQERQTCHAAPVVDLRSDVARPSHHEEAVMYRDHDAEASF
jgi:hypothetical protein